MSEFGRESVATQPDIDRNAKSRRAGPMILEARQTYVAFQELCAESKLLMGGDWLNVEEVFGVAETLKYAGVRQISLGSDVIAIEDLIARIQTWIWKTYQQLPVLRGAARPAALPNREPYQKLFSTLKNLDLARRATIITTNYDIVAEYFAYLAEIPVHYPMKWDPSFGVTASDQSFVARSGRSVDGPALCKLHGSVNFFEDRKGSLQIAADVGDGREKVGQTGAGRFKDEPTIVMYDAIWKIQQDHPELRPAIVPPSYAKLHDASWLSTTWTEARDALTHARLVIFIGYSLPRTDGSLRALLVGSQVVRMDGIHPRVVVIDLSPEVRTEYEKLYHSIEPGGEMSFSTAMDGTLDAILEEFSAL